MMKEPSLTKANYTKLLKDVSSSLLDHIETLLDDNFSVTDIASMYDVFMGMWAYYEICDEDENVFQALFDNTYNEHINYYKELYDNYIKEYNYATGNKRTMVRHDESSSSNTGVEHTVDDGSTKDYDLPNKVVSDTSADGYMTGKTKNDNTSHTNIENSRHSYYDSSVTHTYDNEFLDLKRKYLEQIRNLYREFAQKFSECFLHLFS